MKTTVLLGLLLAACEPAPKYEPRQHSANYECSDEQWVKVERRAQLCETQSKWSKPFEGCPNHAIRSVCTFKGDLNDNPDTSLEHSPTP